MTGQAGAAAAAAAGDRAADAGRLMRIASLVSVSVAGTLILLKFFAWAATGSVAMLSSLIDSALDAAASIVNLIAVRQALTPADREHRFGHGKAEALAGLVQAAFIAGSAFFLLFEAGDRLFNPRPVTRDGIGIAVMVVSIVLTLGLVLFQRHVVRRSGSLAIGADSLHYTGDLLANVAVIVALVLSARLGWQMADPLFAVLIAGYIGHGAWQIVRLSLNQLMDRELPDEERRRIRELALAHPEVIGLHDLRTRTSGTQTFIQLHLVLPRDLILMRAHEIADQVEAEIQAAYPAAEVMIHQDPEGVEEEPVIFRR